jgi:hypothetical protein
MKAMKEATLIIAKMSASSIIGAVAGRVFNGAIIARILLCMSIKIRI